MAYTITMRPRARRAFRRLDAVVRKNVGTAIDGLADDPHPADAKALTGHRPYLRIRVGDYRVIYAVDDPGRLVIVAVVGHRREVYRRLGEAL